MKWQDKYSLSNMPCWKSLTYQSFQNPDNLGPLDKIDVCKRPESRPRAFHFKIQVVASMCVIRKLDRPSMVQTNAHRVVPAWDCWSLLPALLGHLHQQPLHEVAGMQDCQREMTLDQLAQAQIPHLLMLLVTAPEGLVNVQR